jgi:hypothetical protein
VSPAGGLAAALLALRFSLALFFSLALLFLLAPLAVIRHRPSSRPAGPSCPLRRRLIPGQEVPR